MAIFTHIWIFFNLQLSQCIFTKKYRLHKYRHRIVLVRPHVPDMYPDISTLFSTEHVHYQETLTCDKYNRHLCLLS